MAVRLNLVDSVKKEGVDMIGERELKASQSILYPRSRLFAGFEKSIHASLMDRKSSR